MQTRWASVASVSAKLEKQPTFRNIRKKTPLKETQHLFHNILKTRERRTGRDGRRQTRSEKEYSGWSLHAFFTRKKTKEKHNINNQFKQQKTGLFTDEFMKMLQMFLSKNADSFQDLAVVIVVVVIVVVVVVIGGWVGGAGGAGGGGGGETQTTWTCTTTESHESHRERVCEKRKGNDSTFTSSSSSFTTTTTSS